MKLDNWKNAAGYHHQRDLPDNLTVGDIEAVLPGIKRLAPSADGKADSRFTFLADGKPCAIWRWKESSWSCYGPEHVFIQLGLLPA